MASLESRQPRSKFMKKREAHYGVYANSPLQHQYPPITSPASPESRLQHRPQSRNRSHQQPTPAMAHDDNRSKTPVDDKTLPVVPSFGAAGDGHDYHQEDADGDHDYAVHRHHHHEIPRSLRPMQSDSSLRSKESHLTENLDIPITRHPKHIAVLQAEEVVGTDEALPVDYEVQNGTRCVMCVLPSRESITLTTPIAVIKSF